MAGRFQPVRLKSNYIMQNINHTFWRYVRISESADLHNHNNQHLSYEPFILSLEGGVKEWERK